MRNERYQLVAFDMDGTLLNSSQEITLRTVAAMHAAAEAGKIIALCTGRALSELGSYLREGLLNDVRYGILCSGSMLYDFKKLETIDSTAFTAGEISSILEATKGRDVALQLMVGADETMSRDAFKNLDKYGMDVYRKLYEETATLVEDTRELAASGDVQCVKINLWHAGTDPAAEREKTKEALAGLKFATAYAERSNYELNPPGTSKGSGLMKLCALCGIPLAETIGVGDADNDRTMFETAGLAVAMGNASDSVKELTDAIVSDNDHDGCAEVIEKFLMGR